MKSMTKVLHARVNDSGSHPSVTPLYQCSAFEADSRFFYSRKNNPNIAELEEVVCMLEGAKHAVAVTCGMTAIYACLEFLSPGDVVVINKHIYGCSFKLLQRVCKRRNCKLTILDLSENSSLADIPKDTKMVFFETPTNPFLKTINIRRVSDYVKTVNPDALVIVDNTWASPLFQHPLEHEADISLHSGTKYIGGHSDVMSGVLLTNRDDLYDELSLIRFYGGMVLSPESAWLVRRSIQTLQVRIHYQRDVTRDMQEFLSTLAQVEKVYYPDIDGDQLTDYGGILFFDLREDLVDRYADFASALSLFGTGTGMACVTSMVAQPYTGSHASMSPEEKLDMGLGRRLVRLCFGLEDPDDLRSDIMSAFRAIDASGTISI